MSTHPPRTPPDEILLDCANQALAEGMRLAATAELLTPVLVLATEGGRFERYTISTPGIHPSEVMKVLIWAHRATHAAISFEGWTYEQRLPPEGPEREAFLATARRGRRPPGTVLPRDHPDRHDVLFLGSQGPGDQRQHRTWRITNGTPRTFAEQEPWSDETHELARSNFWPMMAPPALIRGLIREYAYLAHLRDTVRERRS